MFFFAPCIFFRFFLFWNDHQNGICLLHRPEGAAEGGRGATAGAGAVEGRGGTLPDLRRLVRCWGVDVPPGLTKEQVRRNYVVVVVLEVVGGWRVGLFLCGTKPRSRATRLLDNKQACKQTDRQADYLFVLSRASRIREIIQQSTHTYVSIIFYFGGRE